MKGAKPAKALVIVSPDGFENALEDLPRFAARGDQSPDMDKLLAVADRDSVKIVGHQWLEFEPTCITKRPLLA